MAPPVAELEQHRVALAGHCYRMLGSSVDADDAVQETMVRAWRSLERFDGRSSLRTWLYRIATNVCLDALADRKARVRPVDEGSLGSVDDVLDTQPHAYWVEPIADARAVPLDVDPAERVMLRQSIRVAFVAALQRLPARQRAALLLTEVLGFSAAEAASALDMSLAALNSALQRARATLAEQDAAQARVELSPEQAELVDRYCAAFERYDIDALTSLLHTDATLSMPPFTLWLRGHESIRTWMLGRGAGCRGSRLVRTSACGAPTFAQYRPASHDGSCAPGTGGYTAWAIVLLDVRLDGIASVTSYLDVEALFPRFGLPLRLP
jgi:RNA polymerase sigma-70 factor (ECF subfamily)